ncbi:MAG: hypothetical protein ACRDSE_08450 [Pseudonocardiaceae bacterium]
MTVLCPEEEHGLLWLTHTSDPDVLAVLSRGPLSRPGIVARIRGASTELGAEWPRPTDEALDESLDRLVRLGYVAADGDRYRLTSPGEAVADRLRELEDAFERARRAVDPEPDQ